MRSLALAAALSVLALVLAPVGAHLGGISAGETAGGAQSPVGSIAGTVKDSAGAPVPGATIRIVAQGMSPYSTLSDAKGSFTFQGVPVAEYEVTATLPGFRTFTGKIAVTAKTAARLEIVLQPAGPAESAKLQAEAPLMDALMRAGAAQGRTAAVAGSMPTASPVGGLVASSPEPRMPIRPGRPDFNTEAYDRIDENPFHLATQDPLSTFSIDVDTASYANVRRYLNRGSLPPPDAVRIEELINYFRFDYPRPGNGAPFSVTTELAPCPWNPKHRLALVGLQAQPLDMDEVPARNLVFLLDVSGSMEPSDKLPLIRTAMRMLVDTLTAHDRIAIVVYAGASGIVLPSTSGAHKERIHEAIARLEAGGSTNGGAGITLAYQVAQEQFVKGGINRVILATDGDFNVGVTNQGDLTRLIEEKRASGIFLSVLGVGTGNTKDSTMEKLADRGNGNYAYLDSLNEARKVLVREAGATLVTVAKDVKIQIEFNPVNVAAYRLIGYENRLLKHQDFNDDRKDAGEIGAGHTVTALYEIVPVGSEVDVPGVDPLKYQRPAGPAPGGSRDELMTVKLRYKAPDGDVSKLISVPVKNNRTTEMSPNVGFAAAVVEFGMLLRESQHRGSTTHADAVALARRFRGSDPDGYRAEFVRLVEIAEALTKQKQVSRRIP
jgi:Ca-activated chloride channel family protein